MVVADCKLQAGRKDCSADDGRVRVGEAWQRDRAAVGSHSISHIAARPLREGRDSLGGHPSRTFCAKKASSGQSVALLSPVTRLHRCAVSPASRLRAIKERNSKNSQQPTHTEQQLPCKVIDPK